MYINCKKAANWFLGEKGLNYKKLGKNGKKEYSI